MKVFCTSRKFAVLAAGILFAGALSVSAGELPLLNPGFEVGRTSNIGDIPSGWDKVQRGFQCLNGPRYGYQENARGLKGTQLAFGTQSEEITGDGLKQVLSGVKPVAGTSYVVTVGVGTRNFPDRFAGLTIELGVQGGELLGRCSFGVDEIAAKMNRSHSGHQVVEVTGVITCGTVSSPGDLELILQAGGGKGGRSGRQSLDLNYVRIASSDGEPISTPTQALSTLPATDEANFEAPCGQSFTAGDGFDLVAIDIAGTKSPGPAKMSNLDPFVVALHEDQDGDPTTWTLGAEVGRTVPNQLKHDGASVSRFSFARPVSLKKGQVYLVRLVTPSGGDANVRFGVAESLRSVGGQVFHKGQSVFNSRFDLAFALISGGEVQEMKRSSVVTLNGLSLELRKK